MKYGSLKNSMKEKVKEILFHYKHNDLILRLMKERKQKQKINCKKNKVS
jgi:hypothetical protein